MTRNIDELAESSQDSKPPAKKLKETFLRSRPDSQWPPYLDETAKDIVSGIAIGDTNLDKYNFPREVGPIYRSGLVAATEGYSDLPETLTTVDETDLGRAMFLLNRLEYQINRSNTGLENTQRAMTAVLEKVLTDTAESKASPRLNEESNSTADILIQMLSDPVVASRVETVLDTFEEVYHSGLLAKLDNPQMMTPLWEHQRDAINEWLQAGSQGYVDMATATGKTVLGLAAIASHYGSLHPMDADIDPEPSQKDGKADVLVVAHNELILEQWRREFDRHLNIPSERTQGSNDIELSWGRVHFRTAQALLNQELVEYDLVVLDEAHHYASGTGWGQLLDEFDNRVLALSGSVDTNSEESSRIRDRLESTIGTECKRYTLSQAQRDGIIPTFEWAVKYTSAEGGDGDFAEITQQSQKQFQKFIDRLKSDDVAVDTDRRLRTFDDVRKYSHTTEGKSLKQNDEQFRDLVTALFSRRTQRWNQSPEVEDVIDVIARYRDRKVVVLTNNNAQIDAITERLDDCSYEKRVFSIRSSDSSAEQRDTVEQFDAPGNPDVLVGTGDLLGEGVDMQHAEVGINMATGSVNKQLIQRIGRVLRNPDGDKHAKFVNLVGIPIERDAQVPAEDGQSLLEEARRFTAFGTSFDNDPTFTVIDGIETGLNRLLQGGYERITSFEEDGVYDRPNESGQADVLKNLLAAIREHRDSGGARAVLRAWSPDEAETAQSEATADTEPNQETNESEHRIELQVMRDDGVPVSGAFVSLAGDNISRFGKTNDDGEIAFSNVHGDCTAGIYEPNEGVLSLKFTKNDQPIDRSVSLVSEESS